jgi:hypothetical protein
LKNVIESGYSPRKFQATLHLALKRFNVLVCHRRFGKTVFSINHLLDKAIACKSENPQYAYIGPNYGQVKRVAWDMLKKYTKNIPGVTYNEAELKCEFPRAVGDKVKILLLSAENPSSVKGIYLDGVILDEFAECDPIIWGEVVRPALADRFGWAIFIGTPKGLNHFHSIYEVAVKNSDRDWFSAIYKASQTKVIPGSELESAKREMSEDEYEQEFECSFTAAISGSYYGKLIEECDKEGRITNVPYDRALMVDTFWDLGIGDTTAIWFLQQYRQEFRLIDYVEMSGVGIDWYVNDLQKKNYIYRDHVMPHDAAAKELGTGLTRQEKFRDLGLRKTIILPRQNVDDGISASRLLLPKCWFDRVKCERGLKALKNYQRKWDSKNQIWSDRPLHDWSSNGADAFRTLAMGNRLEADRRDTNRQKLVDDMNYDIFGG